jgi:PEP-CTERM motif
MSKMRFLFAPACLALILSANAARADIAVTLTSGNISQTIYSAAGTDSFANFFTLVPNYTIEIETAYATTPGVTSNLGTLSSTLIASSAIGSASATNPLTVLIQEVNSAHTALNTYSVPNTSNYGIQNTLTVNSPIPATVDVTGNSQFDANNPQVAAVGASLSNSTSAMDTNMAVIGPVSGYELSHSYTLTGVQAGTSGLTVNFTTSISPTNSPAAVPEPSSLVLTGLVAIGLGGFAFRRRMRSRSL